MSSQGQGDVKSAPGVTAPGRGSQCGLPTRSPRGPLVAPGIGRLHERRKATQSLTGGAGTAVTVRPAPLTADRDRVALGATRWGLGQPRPRLPRTPPERCGHRAGWRSDTGRPRTAGRCTASLRSSWGLAAARTPGCDDVSRRDPGARSRSSREPLIRRNQKRLS